MGKASQLAKTQSPAHSNPEHSDSAEPPLTQGAIAPHLARLCIPPIFGLLAVFSYYLADAYFVAKLGLLPLAAFAFIAPITFIFITVSVALGVGCTSVISQHISHKGFAQTRILARNALLLAFLIASVLGIAGYSSITPLFRMMGADEQTLPYIRTYMQIWFFSFVLIGIHIPVNNIIRSMTGSSITPAIFTVSSALFNIILDPILIFGFWRIPAMGVAGSAWATLIASCFTLCGMAWLLFWKNKLIDCFAPLKWASILEDWKRIFRIFGFAVIENVSAPLGGALTIGLVSRYGVESAAAIGIIDRIYILLIVPYNAIFIGLIPFIGQNWTKQHYERIRQALFLVLKAACLYWLATIVVMIFAASWMARQFTPLEEIIGWVHYYYVWFYVFTGGVAIAVIASALFYGMQYPILPSLLAIMAWVIFLPCALLFMPFWEFKGIFFAMGIADVATGVIATYLLWRSKILHLGKPS